ncbi:Retinoblastoma-like protein 1 [Turnera subulata]|uniref:RHOMBOID-like protein n=1 Tax=Turnera subulata TaxID=218843 RepID=A0A9Q0FR05_9ROSI|nr:Retinoblastoma-like protein 1 [Turnera subulata]
MEKDRPVPPSPSDIQLRVDSKRGATNVIHPVGGVTPPLPSSGVAGPLVYTEGKHFQKWFPWLIPSFVIANVVMFIFTMYVNNCPKNSATCIARFLGRLSFQPFKENPLLGPSSDTLQKLGALDVGKVVHEHPGWRLLTCLWLHAGLFHLLANMLSLPVIGIRLEQEFGFGMLSKLWLFILMC